MNESGFQTADDRDKVKKTLQSKAKQKVLIIEGPEVCSVYTSFPVIPSL